MAQGNTPTGAPNGVVMPPLDPPGLYTRYASSQSTVLGWVQVVTGCMVITNAIMSLATYKDDAIVGDLFTGVLIIIAGACGVGAGKYKTHAPIVGFMVLSTISAVVAVCAVMVWSVAVGEVNEKYAGTDYVGVATATGCIFVFAYLTESVVSIWSSVIACNVTCCTQRGPTVSVARFDPRLGTDTFLVGGYATSSSSNPPTYLQHGSMPQPPYYTGCQQPAYGLFQTGGYGMQQDPYGMPLQQQQQQQQQQQLPARQTTISHGAACGRDADFGVDPDFGKIRQ
ncbi:hypothetical protein NP493_578g03002 [Ridgeia piscesae]|uniref:Uncharacterized protein n=1 Tax=Ridgeia piscesae TaxID=27915 RepID=A0AAD9NR82_RIDPI|nr:hypothetical protein NP493_578g03002 [Ridgeia piscesae]